MPETEMKLKLTIMQGNLDGQKEETERWMNRARKKSQKLIECENWLRKANAAVDRQKDEDLWKSIGSFLTELSLQLGAESK